MISGLWRTARLGWKRGKTPLGSTQRGGGVRPTGPHHSWPWDRASPDPGKAADAPGTAEEEEEEAAGQGVGRGARTRRDGIRQHRQGTYQLQGARERATGGSFDAVVKDRITEGARGLTPPRLGGRGFVTADPGEGSLQTSYRHPDCQHNLERKWREKHPLERLEASQAVTLPPAPPVMREPAPPPVMREPVPPPARPAHPPRSSVCSTMGNHG